MQLGCHPVAVHIYTQTIHRSTQITTEQHKYKLMWKSAGRAPSLRVGAKKCKFIKRVILGKKYYFLFVSVGGKNKNLMTDALIRAGKDRHVMRTRVLRRPIVYLRVRRSILILLTKTVRCSIRWLQYTQTYIHNINKI